MEARLIKKCGSRLTARDRAYVVFNSSSRGWVMESKSKVSWAWCLHCERAYILDARFDGCPYEGCDGDFMDEIPWEDFLETIGKGRDDVPLVPEKGVVYSQYGA